MLMLWLMNLHEPSHSTNCAPPACRERNELAVAQAPFPGWLQPFPVYPGSPGQVGKLIPTLVSVHMALESCQPSCWWRLQKGRTSPIRIVFVVPSLIAVNSLLPGCFNRTPEI